MRFRVNATLRPDTRQPTLRPDTRQLLLWTSSERDFLVPAHYRNVGRSSSPREEIRLARCKEGYVTAGYAELPGNTLANSSFVAAGG